MRTRTRNPFTTVTTAGLLLPVDLLVRIAEGDPDLKGLEPKKDYHLRADRLNEATSKAWNECQAAWKLFRRKFQALPASDTGTTVTRDEWLLPLFEELDYGRLQTKTKLVIGDKEYAVSHGWENHVAIHLISARYPLDRRTPGVAGAATRSPYSMMQELLNRSARHRWGLVSNGLKLFLLCDNLSLARAANVEFDLEAMMEGEVYADFQLLFLLCHQSRVELLEAERKVTATEKKAAKAKVKKQAKLIEEEAGDVEEDAESEVVPAESAPNKECWLDRWSKQAEQTGVQAREKLRFGVENAIEALGAGFLETRGNNVLRDRLRTGTLSKEDYYRQLLRLVYRLIMTLVAEEKKTDDGSNLLHPPGTTAAVRERYARFYSIGRLRTLAQGRRGTAHPDLYEALKVLFEKLCTGHTSLGIPALGSFLFSTTSTPDLDSSLLSNEALLNCIRSLCITKDESARGGGMNRPVDFGNLGAEELGSVYESLLELHPLIDSDAGPFTLSTAAGNERKTTGSYYTPTSLINCLLDSALDPVVHEAINKPERKVAEKALLNLKVCDPACGSGHFLIAAAERMAKHLARLRTEDDEPSTLAIQHAKRDIIGRCIYGVDLNPMAVELCKVSLWMEALEPGKPLSFLDHSIRMGNSLLGATPEMIANGLPDDAFTAIEGDDKKACAVLKKRNNAERKGLGPLFAEQDAETQLLLQQAAAKLVELPDDRPEDIRAKELALRRHEETDEYRQKQQLADVWCAAFVIRKYFREEGRESSVSGITQSHLNDLAAGRALPDDISTEIASLSRQYGFFHRHLAFPEVSAKGGFDCVLGNPPWERVKLQEKEWFAERTPEIVKAPNAAARKRLIDALKISDPVLHQQFISDIRKAEGESHLMRSSGRYPLCGRGDINTYAVFAESMRDALNSTGRMGVIVPTGIATDDTTKFFFGDLIQSRSLVSLFSFAEIRAIFPATDDRNPCCMLCTSAPNAGAIRAIQFAFGLWSVDEMGDVGKRFTMSPEDIALLNPNTRTCPIFRFDRDAEITKSIYRSVPVLICEARDGELEANPWGLSFLRMFDMANASELFVAPEVACPAVRESLSTVPDSTRPYLPLYEAKMLHQFDHRWSTYARENCNWLTTPIRNKVNKEGNAEPDTRIVPALEKDNPETFVSPRYWVKTEEIESRLVKTDKSGNVVWRWEREWLLGFRDIARNTDDRTCIVSVLPRIPVGHTAPLMFCCQANSPQAACLIACMNSFVMDYAARQKVGGTHLTYGFLKQFPVLPPSAFSSPCAWQTHTSLVDWIMPRVLELVYTAHDLAGFAHDLGYQGTPFRWNPVRRAQLRAELDAGFFYLYGVSREDAAYILDTFLVFKTREVSNHGDYRTKLVILDIYDRMQKAIATGEPYQTLLDPPPADPRVAHPPNA